MTVTTSLQVPNLIATLGSHLTWENTKLAVDISETSFYTSLKGGVLNTRRWIAWIRETSIAHINTIQALFNTVNFCALLYSTYTLLGTILEKYSFSSILGENALWELRSIPILATLAGTVGLGVYVINRLSPLASAEELPKVTVAETYSFQQKVAKVLHISKIVLNIVSAFFIKTRLVQILSLAGSGYCLWKNRQLKWMTFSRNFEYGVPQNHVYQDHITDATVTYNMLVLPSSEQAADATCTICQEEGAKIAFCAKHLFHRDCIADLCIHKSDHFLDGARFRKFQTTYRSGNGAETNSYYYQTEISQDNLPGCPNCRVVPLQNTCSIEVVDTEHPNQVFNSDVVIVDRPPIEWKSIVYAVYNVAQAALACLQTYPALSVLIFHIQKVLVITDFIGYAYTAHLLYTKVNEKFNAQDSQLFKVVVVAALISAAALSCFVIGLVSAYLKPVVLLKNLLEFISADDLKMIDVSFNSPNIHFFIQFLYINKMITALALSIFSTQRKAYLISAATQFFSFIGISKLNWIEFSQTFEGASWFMDTMKSVKLTTYSLVDPANLKSSLRSIYESSSSFFKNSKWDKFWEVTYRDGREISRERVYSVGIQQIKRRLNDEHSFLPELVEYTVCVVDKFYTAVKTRVDEFPSMELA